METSPGTRRTLEDSDKNFFDSHAGRFSHGFLSFASAACSLLGLLKLGLSAKKLARHSLGRSTYNSMSKRGGTFLYRRYLGPCLTPARAPPPTARVSTKASSSVTRAAPNYASSASRRSRTGTSCTRAVPARRTGSHKRTIHQKCIEPLKQFSREAAYVVRGGCWNNSLGQTKAAHVA